LAMTEPSDRDPTWRTAVPFTYNIDYSANHVGNESYIKMIADAPPALLHVGHDVPFKSMYGPSDQFDCWSRRMLTTQEAQDRIGVLRDYVSQLHNAGARLVIPYVCSMFIFGDVKKRTGFWWFYDNWEKYQEFGFGSKPKRDPITWCYGKPRPLNVKEFDAGYVYEPCMNDPDWRRFLRATIAHIAKVGYDGVFSDVNATRCPKACCRRLFSSYLEARYTRKQIRELFGFRSPKDVRMGREGEGLLWVETVRFRGERAASLFAELRNEGRKFRDTFFVLPNLSPFQHVDGVWRRVGCSHVFASWARECPVIMYEEMHQPGLLAEGVVSNFIFQFKYAFAHTGRAGTLLYHAQDPCGVHIGIAEAAAGGGGCLIQGHYPSPEVRRKFRAYFSRHPELFADMLPYSFVGLVFFYEQLAWGTRSHLESAFRIAEELMAKHVLFDLIVERNLRLDDLRRYRAIVACDLENLSDAQANDLLEYVKQGGTLVAIGQFGKSDDRGTQRPKTILEQIPAASWSEVSPGVRQAEYGKGKCIKSGDLGQILSPSPFELFMYTEDEVNDINKVFELIGKSRKQPQQERRRKLVDQVRKAAGEVAISDCEETLRFNAYTRTQGDVMLLMLHAVNYNLPIRARGQSGPVVPAAHIPVKLPLPDGWKAEKIRICSPPDEGMVELPFKQRAAVLSFEIPKVDKYSLVEITAKSGT